MDIVGGFMLATKLLDGNDAKFLLDRNESGTPKKMKEIKRVGTYRDKVKCCRWHGDILCLSSLFR